MGRVQTVKAGCVVHFLCIWTRKQACTATPCVAQVAVRMTQRSLFGRFEQGWLFPISDLHCNL
jgi:hypothetical protein